MAELMNRLIKQMDNEGSPLISIPLCTFNGARFLGDQLDSLLAQTHFNIEIIAVDDCSTDNTVDILNEYARRDSRLCVLVNETNLGFKRNFQKALSCCHGAYIAPCDQDDVWLPKKLGMLLAAIGNQPLIYCDSELIDDSGSSLGIRISDVLAMPTTADPAVFVLANCVSGHAILFRRNLLDTALPIPDDFFYDWWLAAVAAASGGILFLDETLVRYRQHEASVTDILGFRKPIGFRYPPGYRLKNLREIGSRIKALATLPGDNQAFLVELDHLWQAREHQWVSIGLAWFLALHSRRLYALQKENVSSFKLVRRSVKFSWGLRLKRFTNKYAYAS